MQRGVSVEQVRRASKLAQSHGIQVASFHVGYQGEEFEGIDRHRRARQRKNPEIFFTTVSYPIKGTGYFEKVRDRVARPSLGQGHRS